MGVSAIDASNPDLLQILQQHADQCTLRLAKAPLPSLPTPANVTEADFPGYQRSQLAGWSRDTTIAANLGAALSRSNLWEVLAAGVPQQVYGGYVVWQPIDAAPSVVAFNRFPTPQRLEQKGASLLVAWLIEAVALVDPNGPAWVSVLSGAAVTG